MIGYRASAEATAGPSRCSLVGGGAHLLVRLRLYDDGGDDPQPEVFCDLRPDEALELARQLLAAHQQADIESLRARYWRSGQ